MSDLTLQQRVRRCLDDAAYASLHQICASVDGARVTLEGAVGSFYEKQLAQELVKHVPGVIEVVNLLQVADGQGMSGAEP